MKDGDFPSEKPGIHPRNRHRGRYDFKQLVETCPDLAPFVSVNPYGDASIDFADPDAVKALNRALMMHFYGTSMWEIPANYLCPPIPGRADYLHHVADLLGSSQGGVVPRGPSVRVLDVGVGASCIYPLIGHAEYGWSFLGSDVDPVALAAAKRIVQANGSLGESIQFRLQASPANVFKGLLQPGEAFDLTICNPPFHGSLEEAHAGSRRKWKNLGKSTESRTARGAGPLLNFGGQSIELWCAGGEKGFVSRMIRESAEIPAQCAWFTTLVSKEDNLPMIYRELGAARVADSRTIDMAQGQKKSRIVAWTFSVENRQAERENLPSP